jgi:hypothetical protein
MKHLNILLIGLSTALFSACSAFSGASLDNLQPNQDTIFYADLDLSDHNLSNLNLDFSFLDHLEGEEAEAAKLMVDIFSDSLRIKAYADEDESFIVAAEFADSTLIENISELPEPETFEDYKLWDFGSGESLVKVDDIFFLAAREEYIEPILAELRGETDKEEPSYFAKFDELAEGRFGEFYQNMEIVLENNAQSGIESLGMFDNFYAIYGKQSYTVFSDTTDGISIESVKVGADLEIDSKSELELYKQLPDQKYMFVLENQATEFADIFFNLIGFTVQNTIYGAMPPGYRGDVVEDYLGVKFDQLTDIFASPFTLAISEPKNAFAVPSFQLTYQLEDDEVADGRTFVVSIDEYFKEFIESFNSELEAGQGRGLFTKDTITVDGSVFNRIKFNADNVPFELAMMAGILPGFDPSSVQLEFVYGVSDSQLIFAMVPDYQALAETKWVDSAQFSAVEESFSGENFAAAYFDYGSLSNYLKKSLDAVLASSIFPAEDKLTQDIIAFVESVLALDFYIDSKGYAKDGDVYSETQYIFRSFKR